MTRHLCLAVCPPGVEELTAGELTALGVRVRRTFRGGVEFSATPRQLYAVNYWVRTATRVVVRVGRFVAASFGELERHASAIDWAPFVPDGTTPTVRASSTSSKLHHTGAIEERLAAVIGSGTGEGPLVVARVMHDRVTLSVDSSGDPLHMRGWRLDPAKAPLRETLAAALVLASGWDGTTPFVDPFCGSGTIAIEAALLAAGMPPGGGRRFAFERWPSFEPGTFASVRAPRPAKPAAAILASDRDEGAVAAARANAARAGVAEMIEIARVTFSAVDAPADNGALVTNPPYGKRVAGGDLRDLYAALGRCIRERFSGWTVAMLVADRALAGHAGLALEERLRADNGGIPVAVVVREGAPAPSPATAPPAPST